MEESSAEPFEVNDANCQKRMDEFVAVTGTNEALAMFFLQDRDWNLDRSVNDYFNQLASEEGALEVKPRPVKRSLLPSSDDEVEIVETPGPSKTVKPSNVPSNLDERGDSVAKPEVMKDKRNLTFITWNIDGLDQKNIKIRTQAACKIVNELQADVVFFQEVIKETEKILVDSLGNYTYYNGGLFKGFEADYFTATFVRKSSATVDSNVIVDYTETAMCRNILHTRVKFDEITLNFLNTHLESTKDFAVTRMRQLRECFELAKKLPANEAVILAGDLNMRDKELDSIGGIPSGLMDVWVSTGSRKECQYTWDMMRNDNLEGFGKFKPRCRFDRIYYRDANPSKALPHNFSLIGLQRLKPHVCFPSDHWGLMCTLRLNK